jgi:hypothetical protein
VFPGSTDPETLEMLACREACALAGDLSLRRVRVATDCSNVVRSSERGTMGALSHIVRENRGGEEDFPGAGVHPRMTEFEQGDTCFSEERYLR